MDDPLRACLKTVRFHLVRNDHVNEPSGHRCTMALIEAIDRALSAAPSSETAAQGSVPKGWRLVPAEFVLRVLTLAHNWSLQAIPPEQYQWGNEGSAFIEAYRRCGRDMAEVKALLAAAPRSTETGR